MAALGAAARETRAADQAARAALWNFQPGRVRPVEGLLSIPGKYMVNPHRIALARLQSHLEVHQHEIAALYENAARAYADGAASALLSVVGGEYPQFVELLRDETGHYSSAL
ncbi:hypothetical protein, partial [Streptomyces sp. UNOC14_S4]|uniref:hypothetical protein n=1 Tax=Streptomyces sp. UNOC14_S4 TaxID=2872340 RepID=UPI001E57E81A